MFRARKINEYMAASSSDARASAKHMRLVTSMQREGPWERERGDFFPSLRPLRAQRRRLGTWQSTWSMLSPARLNAY